MKTAQFNITAIFDHELNVGPLSLNLADLGFTQDLQDAFDMIPTAFMALALFFIMGTGLTGLSFLAAVGAIVLLPRNPRVVIFANVTAAWLAVLTLLISSSITQGAASKAVDMVNSLGDDVGISATFGTKFSRISWASVCLMLIAASYWTYLLFRPGMVPGIRRLGSRANLGKGRASEESYSPSSNAVTMRITPMHANSQTV
jgi:hypothetical protein